MSEIEDIAILGSSHKRFGYNEPIEYDFGIYYETFNGTDKRIVKCAVPIKRYTFSLIAKCVTYYLTHPKMIDSIICPYISIYRGVMVAAPVRPRRATGLD